jgi:hypothetical protein
MADIKDLSNDAILLAMQDEIEQLRLENSKLKIILTEAGIEDDALNKISNEEAICVSEIKKLRDKSNSPDSLTLNETKQLEIYVKNLKAIRGEDKRFKSANRTSKLTQDELIQIALEDDKVG